MSCNCTSWAFNLLRLIYELSPDSWILHLFVVHMFPLPVYNTVVVKPYPEVRSTRRVRNVTYCSAIPNSGSGFAAIIQYKLWKSVCIYSLHPPPPNYLGAAYAFLLYSACSLFPYIYISSKVCQNVNSQGKLNMCYTKLRGSVQEMKEKNTDTLVNVYFCNGTHINVLKLLFVTQYQMMVPLQL
jgi:hypothetical protein